jgi:hypothetical protein
MNTTTTIQQLCGGNIGRLVTMIGAHSFVAGANELRFQFKGSKKANRVLVELTPADTYAVSFYAGRGVNIRKVAEFADVYADTLRGTFEKFTGLYVSL